MSIEARYGFRCDSKHGERRLVEAAAAFLAQCHADPRTEPDRERYLSAFAFTTEFKTHHDTTNSTADYKGRCWSNTLWFDIDRDDPAAALDAAKGLVTYTLMQFHEFDGDHLLIFFSGKRGYHVGLPLTHNPPPSTTFNAVCRAVAERIAAERQVVIDSGIYDKVRLLRAPNSKHPTTGLHKVRLTYAELMGLSHERIAELARTPIPFDPPTTQVIPKLLPIYWQEAEVLVNEKLTAKVNATTTAGRLNRATMDYIRNGSQAGGSRHISLFSAAANLREFGASDRLISALLEEVALDDGLPPKDVQRQILCGIQHAEGGGA